MSVPTGTQKTTEDIADLKEQYINFYKVVPMQKWAAKFIGRDEDTILRWRNEDAEFADKVKKAESEAVKSRITKVRADWFLERVFKEDFAQRTEVTGKDGAPLTAATPEDMEAGVKAWLELPGNKEKVKE